MPSVKLTDAAVQRLKAAPGPRVDFFDAAFPGLCLRVTGAIDQRPERRTWTLFYRFGGKQKRLTFEPGYPAIGLGKARELANAARLELQAGQDPSHKKAAAKAKAAREPDTLEDIVELYLERDLKQRNRSAAYIAAVRRNFDNHVLPQWSGRSIQSITRRDVVDLLDAVSDGKKSKNGVRPSGGRIASNRVLASIRAMFRFCERRGLIPLSPVGLLQSPGEETRRERLLSPAEIRSVWLASNQIGFPFGHFTKALLLLGQRRAEVAGMRWADIDFDDRVWFLAAKSTKAGRGQLLPLPSSAVDLLRSVPRVVDSPWVFTTNGNTPISGYSKGKMKLDSAIMGICGETGPMQAWHLHDLRRTAASNLARLQTPRLVISKLLNHSDGSVTGIYDRYEYLPEKRVALEKWSAEIDRIVA
jgi:integrase